MEFRCVGVDFTIGMHMGEGEALVGAGQATRSAILRLLPLVPLKVLP